MNFDMNTLLGLVVFATALLLARLLLRPVRIALQPQAGELARTWKFRTAVYLVLACAVPLWPLSVPLFLWLAHRSYLAGTPQATAV